MYMYMYIYLYVLDRCKRKEFASKVILHEQPQSRLNHELMGSPKLMPFHP